MLDPSNPVPPIVHALQVMLLAIYYTFIFAEKVAGELSDALTAAFDLGSGEKKGDDSYKFDEHF